MTYNLYYFVEGRWMNREKTDVEKEITKFDMEIPRDFMFAVRVGIENRLKVHEIKRDKKFAEYSDGKTWDVRVHYPESEVSSGDLVGISISASEREKLEEIIGMFGLPYDKDRVEYVGDDTRH